MAYTSDCMQQSNNSYFVYYWTFAVNLRLIYDPSFWSVKHGSQHRMHRSTVKGNHIFVWNYELLHVLQTKIYGNFLDSLLKFMSMFVGKISQDSKNNISTHRSSYIEVWRRDFNSFSIYLQYFTWLFLISIRCNLAENII